MPDEKQIETVTMTDGRKVEFAGKRKMLKTSRILDDGALAIILDFRNGETRTFALEPSLKNRYALHGAEQKYGDEVAAIKDVEAMVKTVDGLHARLATGEWGAKRASNEISGTSILLRALAEFTGKPLDELKPWLSEKAPAEKAALRKSTKLLPIIQKLEAEKAAEKAKGDENALFSGL